jgi:DNA (cytosine-5)-methyltransferase 1
MRYGSVCSGVAPQTQAWSELGWQCAWFAEIEPFPSAVLKYRFPETPNLGDFTNINEHTSGPIDVLAGGTPCQSFSVAGKRAGLDDARGNLTIEFARLLARLRPRWFVWENVPGVLSIEEGRTFGEFLGLLTGRRIEPPPDAGWGNSGMFEGYRSAYGLAYRVMDAQFWGVAQRRRRVFVVGHLGDWRRAAAVLFERESLSGNPAPSREKGQGVAASTRDGLANSLGAHGGSGYRQDLDNETYVAHSLRADGFDASEDGTGRGTPLVSVPELARCLSTSNERIELPEVCGTLSDGAHMGGGLNGQDAYTGRIIPTYALQGAGRTSQGSQGSGWNEDVCFTLNITDEHAVANSMAVRRLTPRECERLQGMSDDFTLIPWKGKMAPDGPRYKAIGNSWAVPVLAWIAKRINQVEEN